MHDDVVKYVSVTAIVVIAVVFIVTMHRLDKRSESITDESRLLFTRLTMGAETDE